MLESSTPESSMLESPMLESPMLESPMLESPMPESPMPESPMLESPMPESMRDRLSPSQPLRWPHGGRCSKFWWRGCGARTAEPRSST